MCRMRRTKQEIEAFKEAQEVWRRNKKELLEEENRRIQEYLLFKAREAKSKYGYNFNFKLCATYCTF